VDHEDVQRGGLPRGPQHVDQVLTMAKKDKIWVVFFSQLVDPMAWVLRLPQKYVTFYIYIFF
jgi:hypothetical protein